MQDTVRAQLRYQGQAPSFPLRVLSPCASSKRLGVTGVGEVPQSFKRRREREPPWPWPLPNPEPPPLKARQITARGLYKFNKNTISYSGRENFKDSLTYKSGMNQAQATKTHGVPFFSVTDTRRCMEIKGGRWETLPALQKAEAKESRPAASRHRASVDSCSMFTSLATARACSARERPLT